jgi:hypothetical protein
VRRLIDDRQALDGPTLGAAVEHEVHRPHLVGGQWPDQRLALT